MNVLLVGVPRDPSTELAGHPHIGTAAATGGCPRHTPAGAQGPHNQGLKTMPQRFKNGFMSGTEAKRMISVSSK